MLSDSLLFRAAMVAYGDAAHNAVAAEARLAAARRFRDVVAQLDDDAGLLRPFTIALQEEADDLRAVVATRALVATRWPEATAHLLHALTTDGPHLESSAVRLLGRRSGLPDDAWRMLDDVHEVDRAPLVAALLYRASAEGEQRWHEVMAVESADVAEQAIAAVARWGRPALLRPLLDEPRRPIPKQAPPELRPPDLRLDAAFHLALHGDAAAIDFLVEAAASTDATDAAVASLRLAELGLPAAVAPLDRLLRGDDAHAARVAIAGARQLGTPLLAPALRALVGRAALAGEATSALGSLGTAELDPQLRYRDGAPLAQPALVDDLVSRRPGEATRAALALHALTGEELGLEGDNDLIANLAAIDAWRARPASTPPGAWAFRGERLAPP